MIGFHSRPVVAAGLALVCLSACAVDAGLAGGDGSGAAGAGAGGEAGAGGGPDIFLIPVTFGDSIGPINEGFIGGPCDSDADCMYDGGFCLTEAQGFPDGMCSLDCGGYCPDQPGMVTTFCPNPEALGTSADAGLCTARCDYGQSPTGCREGYQCQQLARYGNAASQVFACVPGLDNPHVLSECQELLLARDVAFSPATNPKDSPDGFPELICDIEDPVWVEPNLSGVAFRPGSLNEPPASIFTACQHAIAMLDAAQLLAGQGVVDVVHYGVYNCRTIAGTSTLSEHAFANAIDIAGVKLANDGPFYTVLADWEKNVANPMTPGGSLLHSFAQSIYDEYVYNIVLSPNYNDAHADHLHCDLTPGSHFFQ